MASSSLFNLHIVAEVDIDDLGRDSSKASMGTNDQGGGMVAPVSDFPRSMVGLAMALDVWAGACLQFFFGHKDEWKRTPEMERQGWSVLAQSAACPCTSKLFAG